MRLHSVINPLRAFGRRCRTGRAALKAAVWCGACAGGSFLLVLAGCSRLSEERPPVADSTMVEVLTELHLTQARMEVQGNLPPATRDSIFNRYGIDEGDFEAAMAYYAEHPDVYLEVHGQLLDRLDMEAVYRE